MTIATMASSGQLARYEAAKRALAEAKAVDEVKQLRDISAAMQAYARQANDRQMEIDAAEIRIRAERRLGEMLREQKETVGLAQGKRTDLVPQENQVDDKPTLSEVGIDKKLSARSQAIAGIPEDEFEQTLAEHRQEQQAVTARTMETLAKKAHVANNSGENEWYTPSVYVEEARAVMGRIDCDPASSDLANQTVRAGKYYTKDEDGLEQEWFGSVFMNPPYSQPEIGQFINALVDKYVADEIDQAIVLVNNATDTAWFQKLLSVAGAVCLPKGRIKFIDKQGNPTGAPLQGQAIVYVGTENTSKFHDYFSRFGAVLWV